MGILVRSCQDLMTNKPPPGVAKNPESVFHEFMDALSKGTYYVRRIRGRYR
jgi:hypothetical protein